MASQYLKSWGLGNILSTNNNTLTENYLNMIFSQAVLKNVLQGDRLIIAAIGAKVTPTAFVECHRYFGPVGSSQVICDYLSRLESYQQAVNQWRTKSLCRYFSVRRTSSVVEQQQE